MTLSPASMAPFVRVGTAISGAGIIFFRLYPCPPLALFFNTLPAASIVGTTRGKRLNIILFPADPPGNTYIGRLACLLPGSLAAFLDPKWGDMLAQIKQGAHSLAANQRLLGYSIMDAAQTHERIHQLMMIRAVRAPFLAVATEDKPLLRMPIAFRIKGSSVPQDKLISGNYFRNHLRTDDRYALITAGPWSSTGYRAVDDPNIEFYKRGKAEDLQIYYPGRREFSNSLILSPCIALWTQHLRAAHGAVGWQMDGL